MPWLASSQQGTGPSTAHGSPGHPATPTFMMMHINTYIL